jgi:hypothetical protein
MSSSLAGTWELVEFVSRDPDGAEVAPFGAAIGRLMYDAHGNMAGQIMQPGREPVGRGDDAPAQAHAAYSGYIAYFGTYVVDDERGIVTHHVAGSINPAIVGSSQVRRIRFDGQLLILEADFRTSRGVVVQTLTWRRRS